MPRCEYIETCLFFHDTMGVSTVLADVIKKCYCLGRSENCARLRVRKALGQNAVPLDLFPDMQERADEIIFRKG